MIVLHIKFLRCFFLFNRRLLQRVLPLIDAALPTEVVIVMVVVMMVVVIAHVRTLFRILHIGATIDGSHLVEPAEPA